MIKANVSNRILLDRNLTSLIKFASCIIIALHHYSQWAIASGADNIIYKLFSTQGGWFGIAVFYFLSGYGLMKSDTKNHLQPFVFLKRRIYVSYLPAVLVSSIWGLYLLISGTSFSTHWLLGIIWYFNDEVLWFVRAIIWLYLFFYLYVILCRALTTKTQYHLITNALLLVAIAFVAMYFLNLGLMLNASIVFFFIGISVAQYDCIYLKLIKNKHFALIIYIIAALIIVSVHNPEWIHIIINFLIIITGLILFACYDITMPNLPKWISVSSYDIYLVHNKVLMLLLPHYTIIPLWIYVTVCGLCTIAFYQIRKFIHI